MQLHEVIEDLSKPFPPERVHWRIGSRTKDKKKGKPLAYIDARDVMDRLDETVGPENWTDSYDETPSGRILCRLTILGVSKEDGAGDTDFEGAKGAISDALKRTAVKFGIGRYLYGIETPWIELDNGYMPRNFKGDQYLPGAAAFSSKPMRTKYWRGLCDAASDNDMGKARELWDELNTEQRQDIWRELSSGVRSTLKELLKEEAV